MTDDWNSPPWFIRLGYAKYLAEQRDGINVVAPSKNGAMRFATREAAWEYAAQHLADRDYDVEPLTMKHYEYRRLHRDDPAPTIDPPIIGLDRP